MHLHISAASATGKNNRCGPRVFDQQTLFIEQIIGCPGIPCDLFFFGQHGSETKNQKPARRSVNAPLTQIAPFSPATRVSGPRALRRQLQADWIEQQKKDDCRFDAAQWCGNFILFSSFWDHFCISQLYTTPHARATWSTGCPCNVVYWLPMLTRCQLVLVIRCHARFTS